MTVDRNLQAEPSPRQLSLWGDRGAPLVAASDGKRLGGQGLSLPGGAPVISTSASAVKADKVALQADMNVRAAFVALAHGGLDHLTANERAILFGADPEAVHQMRIAIRRLRALLAAFAPQLDGEAATFLRGELKWLQRRLGPARDWDVFLLGTVAPLLRRLPDEPGLAEMRDAAFDARRRAYLLVHRTLSERRYARFLMRFRLWLDAMNLEERRSASADRSAPVAAFAAKLLGKRHRQLTRLGARRDLAEEEMHRLRLRAKNLRYAAEFFRPLYRGKPPRRFVKTLAALQDRLGSLQDAVVGRGLVAQMALPSVPSRKGAENERRGGAPFGSLDQAIAMAVGFQTARIVDDMRRFKDVWPAFAGLKAFWRKTA
ncbi:MAG TPA: CHAD domain-containing protein [Alphaproteobacteria bacterium]|jgi:CHAD domain-containing protein